MHGRPRKAPKPEDAAASAAKSQKLQSLQFQFLSFHHSRTYSLSLSSTSWFPTVSIFRSHCSCFHVVFFSLSLSHSYTKEALETSAKLLEINPENYTAWNYRKLAVEHNVKESESDPDSIKSIFDEELRVVRSLLQHI